MIGKHEEIVAASLEQVDGEEIASAFDAMATVLGTPSTDVAVVRAHGTPWSVSPDQRAGGEQGNEAEGGEEDQVGHGRFAAGRAGVSW